MPAVFLKILNMSITAGWIALAVMILRLLLGKMPKQLTCMLWSLVGLRLIFPFSPESIFSLIPNAETVPETLLPGALPEIDSGIPMIDHIVNPAAKASFSYLSTGRSGTEAFTLMLRGAVILWLAGIFLMLSYLIFSYLRLYRKMSTAVLLKDNVRQSEFVDSPFILGIIRPRIYIPFHLDEEVLSHVLAHERAHLSRRDHLIKAFAFVLLAVYWFHPLLWVSYVLLCRDIELACDEKVIQNYGSEERKSYLFSLIGYDEKAENRKKISSLVCPLAFGEVDIKKRIRRAKTWKKPSPPLLAAGILISILAALCLLTNPISSTRQPSELAAPGSAEALYGWRTKYIGDNSAVGNIIYNLSFPEEMTYRQFALQTDDSEPYAVTITFALSEANKEEYDLDAPNRQEEVAQLRQNACIMFSLIENAEIVNFKLVDETDETKRPLTLVYTRQWATNETNCDLWKESETKEQFEVLFIKLRELFSLSLQFTL